MTRHGTAVQCVFWECAEAGASATSGNLQLAIVFMYGKDDFAH